MVDVFRTDMVFPWRTLFSGDGALDKKTQLNAGFAKKSMRSNVSKTKQRNTFYYEIDTSQKGDSGQLIDLKRDRLLRPTLFTTFDPKLFEVGTVGNLRVCTTSRTRLMCDIRPAVQRKRHCGGIKGSLRRAAPALDPTTVSLEDPGTKHSSASLDFDGRNRRPGAKTGTGGYRVQKEKKLATFLYSKLFLCMAGARGRNRTGTPFGGGF